jgi:exosortase H (IPTLxxWG-CTERM-specific)
MAPNLNGFWARNGVAIRFVVVFLGVFALLYWLTTEAAFFVEAVVAPFTLGITNISAWLLAIFEDGVVARGSMITGPHFAVNIMHGCNGSTPAAMIIAGVLAYPATWKARVVGLLAGSLWVQIINLLRIVVLYELGRYGFIGAFESVHLYVAQVVVIIATAAFWLYWIGEFATPRDTPTP